MNKYEVVKTIGEGAYGVVLQCRNKETEELVAIKRFKESDEDELVRKTTLREVRILRLLKDEPYVVRLQEAFRRKGKLYLVFDYVGCNLLDVLEQHPQGLPTEDIRRMVFTMLLGIRACHANGVIHRDIKPENLLVHTDNTLRLCDFGFARVYTPDMNDLTDYVATRWYRSPELLLGTTNYGLPSDIWAVGCIMAELIDGQAIFPCETEVDQIFVIQKLLGNFTPAQMEVFRKNPRFNGYTLKENPKLESSLERKFAKKATKKALSLLKQMLVIDPSKRCTVDEALSHPFFEGLAEVYCPNLQLRTASSTATTSSTVPTATVRPPSANNTKIPALARPGSSLAAAKRVGTPSEQMLPDPIANHHHGQHQHQHQHGGSEDTGGEHDGSSAPNNNNTNNMNMPSGRGSAPSPWLSLGGGGGAGKAGQGSLPQGMGLGVGLMGTMSSTSANTAGGGMLPPARITSAHRQQGYAPAGMLDPMGIPLSNTMMGGGYGSGTGLTAGNSISPSSNVGSFVGRQVTAVVGGPRLPTVPGGTGLTQPLMPVGNLPRINVGGAGPLPLAQQPSEAHPPLQQQTYYYGQQPMQVAPVVVGGGYSSAYATPSSTTTAPLMAPISSSSMGSGVAFVPSAPPPQVPHQQGGVPSSYGVSRATLGSAGVGPHNPLGGGPQPSSLFSGGGVGPQPTANGAYYVNGGQLPPRSGVFGAGVGGGGADPKLQQAGPIGSAGYRTRMY